MSWDSNKILFLFAQNKQKSFQTTTAPEWLVKAKISIPKWLFPNVFFHTDPEQANKNAKKVTKFGFGPLPLSSR